MAGSSTPQHVVVATDDRFAMPTAVTLRSVGEVGAGPFVFTVLHKALSSHRRDEIAASLADLDHVRVDFVDLSSFKPDPRRPTDLPDAAYFRMKIGEVVPLAAGRALYIDVDVIMRHDPTELFAMDLDDHAIGAVRSVQFPSLATPGAVRFWPEANVDPRAPYFNSGVMIIDLARWNDDRIADITTAHARSPHTGHGGDQEAINVALNGRWKQLHPRWNQQPAMLDDLHGTQLLFSDTEIEEARADPAIVHYQRRPKPWHTGCDHPWLDLWLETARRTAFEQIDGFAFHPPRRDARWRVRRAAAAIVQGQ